MPMPGTRKPMTRKEKMIVFPIYALFIWGMIHFFIKVDEMSSRDSVKREECLVRCSPKYIYNYNPCVCDLTKVVPE